MRRRCVPVISGAEARLQGIVCCAWVVAVVPLSGVMVWVGRVVTCARFAWTESAVVFLSRLLAYHVVSSSLKLAENRSPTPEFFCLEQFYVPLLFLGLNWFS